MLAPAHQIKQDIANANDIGIALSLILVKYLKDDNVNPKLRVTSGSYRCADSHHRNIAVGDAIARASSPIQYI